jgi:ribosomal protein S18 acetylase RimI-like enzyme
MLEKTRIVVHTVRSAHNGDWTAILTLAELLKRHDKTQRHPAIPDTAHVFVAVCDDGHIVGMIACHEIKDGIAPISNLYVLESYRRRGIASGLLAAAISYAQGAEVRLTVNRANKQARRIYRRLGFKLSDNVDLRLAVSP